MTLRIDCQTHTNRSRPCGWTAPERLGQAAARRGLDGVAVTDHNTMAAVETVREHAPDDLLVIGAEEIDTPTGQVIGLFLDEPIKAGQSAETTIDRIHEQGGVAFAPHPFDPLREGLSNLSDLVSSIDGIETLNSRCVRRRYNNRAAAFAAEYDLTCFGGSDGHFPHEVGNAWTNVEINEATPTAVREAMRTGHTTVGGQRGRRLNHAGTKVLKIVRSLR